MKYVTCKVLSGNISQIGASYFMQVISLGSVSVLIRIDDKNKSLWSGPDYDDYDVM